MPLAWGASSVARWGRSPLARWPSRRPCGPGCADTCWGAAWYLPEAWLTDAARARARIPASVRVQEKWRQALTVLCQVRESGITVTGVLADAEFGDTGLFRAMSHRLRLPYAVGVSSTQTVFPGRPPAHPTRLGGRGRVGHGRGRRCGPATLAAHQLAQPRRRAAVGGRVCGAARDPSPRLAPPSPPRAGGVAVGRTRCRRHPADQILLRALPATASWTRLVRFAHQRWAIEQQYRELKTDLGLDHFEGRTFPGWHHHVVLTAIAYNFLQAERRRHLAGLTFPAAHAIVQEIFTAYLFAQRPHYLRRIEALRSVQLRI